MGAGAKWYRRAKATKRGERGNEKSQRPHSTVEAGERTQRTPWREGGRRVTEPLMGDTRDTMESRDVLTKQQRIAQGSEPVT